MSTPNTSGDDESGDEVGGFLGVLSTYCEGYIICVGRFQCSSNIFQGDSEGGMTEIRFVPDDASSLDSMFTAMSECQVPCLE